MYLKSGFENTKHKFKCENSKSEFELRKTADATDFSNQ